MTYDDLEKIVQYIISRSTELKNLYTDEVSAKVEFCDIFSRNDEEYQQLTEVIEKIGKIVFPGPTGSIYLLHKPIQSVAGALSYLKIRKPDANLPLRGDADFNTDYVTLKKKHNGQPHFELSVREKFEMLKLSDPKFDVMSCFSNIPVRNWI